MMKDLGYREHYHAHDYGDNFVIQEYLPNELANTKFYEPRANTREDKFKERYKNIGRENMGTRILLLLTPIYHCRNIPRTNHPPFL